MPVPGGPTIRTPRGGMAPARGVAFGVLEEVDDLADLELGAFVAGHIGESRLWTFLVEHLRLGPADSERPLEPPRSPLGEPPPQVADEEDREQQDQPRQHFGTERGPTRLCSDLDAIFLQLVEEATGRPVAG